MACRSPTPPAARHPGTRTFINEFAGVIWRSNVVIVVVAWVEYPTSTCYTPTSALSLLLSLSLFLLLPLTSTFSNLQLNYDQRRRPNQVGEQARLSLIPGCRVRSVRECVVPVGYGKFVLSRSLLVSLSLSTTPTRWYNSNTPVRYGPHSKQPQCVSSECAWGCHGTYLSRDNCAAAWVTMRWYISGRG